MAYGISYGEEATEGVGCGPGGLFHDPSACKDAVEWELGNTRLCTKVVFETKGFELGARKEVLCSL